MLHDLVNFILEAVMEQLDTFDYVRVVVNPLEDLKFVLVSLDLLQVVTAGHLDS